MRSASFEHPSISMKEELYGKIEGNRGNTQRSPWFRDAARMKLEIEEAVEAANMADELDDDWWKDWLYNAAREEADRREQRMVSEERAERDESEV